MNETFNLSELHKKIAEQHIIHLDGALAQYVKSSIGMLQAQGKDITDYTLVQIRGNYELKKDSSTVTQVWKIMKMSDLELRPTRSDE